jgi:RNA polymerase sigma factor for flagellar operon FliA
MMPAEEAGMTPVELSTLATRFIHRIHKIARGICRQLPPHVDAEDLAQAGIVGMMSALRAFDTARGDSVEVYVTRRIRGAILDELRALDPLSRDQRRDARMIQHAQRALEGELGRPPAEDEVAVRAGLSVDRVREVRERSNAATTLPLEGAILDREEAVGVDPLDRLARDKQKTELSTAIGALGAREQTVLSLYYVEELSLKEIGGLLGVTESRVCQIHGVAVKKLRAALAAS